MGLYINMLTGGQILPALNKAKFLIEHAGATRIQEPTQWEEDIVCVVENGPFDAAAYAFSPQELKYFKYPDTRKKHWLKVPNAKQLAQ